MTKFEVEKAANLLRSGGLVAFPTETVYGLGADAKNPDAIRKVFQVKRRPQNHPLIVHLAKIDHIFQWVCNISPEAEMLANAFWPGPMTLIFKKQAHVLDIITGGQDTVALRIPRHPLAQALLTAFGGGIVGPSANVFTRISPTSLQAVREEMGNKIDLILDGGDCEVGLESTIIDISGDDRVPVILRPGMIGRTVIENVIKMTVVDNANSNHNHNNTEVRAPGMHRVHYAPKTKVMLVERQTMAKTITKMLNTNDRVAILAIGERSHNDRCYKALKEVHNNIHIINMPQTAKEYARDLYQTLRSIDQQDYQCIVIEKVPEDESWTAIRDRLLKASASI